MASLRYSQIRVHPEGTINYIANAEKMLSRKSHDIHNVLSYMGDEGSIERVYSFARHCSTNPELAAVQMEMYRTLYYNSKTGGVQGLREGQTELLGLHFFLSFTEEDDPSEETMNIITEGFSKHPLLCDFAMYAARHYDKAHKHIHIFISQYSAVGKPRKICMRYKDFNDLRKYVNHLCVDHGLSIIDLPTLRYSDPEYSAWIDGVIAAGKITIHPESKKHRGSKHQTISTQELYYKWMKEKEENMRLEESRLTAAQLKSKKAKERYYWSIDGNPKTKPYPISDAHRKRYYAVTQYDKTGRKRTLVELICILIITIYRSEMQKHAPPTTMTGHVIHARVDRNVQAMVDSMRLSREMNINTPEDVSARITDTGKQMNGLKKEKARLEASVGYHENIISAWEQYQQTKDAVEGASHPDPDELAKYKAAYAVLARNQILTVEAFEQLKTKHEFQIKKIGDYEKQLATLNRQYRGLKKLQALITHGDRIAEQSYLYNPNVTLDDYLKVVEQKKRIASEALTKINYEEKLSRED